MSKDANGRAWKDVTRSNPCPICGKPDWCSVSQDGDVVMCRRQGDAGQRKVDKAGVDYYIHRLRPSSSSSGEPRYSLADGKGELADPDTLHKVYHALISVLALSDKHAADLNARGLKMGLRSAGYRTLPERGRAKAVRRLIDAGFEEHFPRVPGFFVGEYEGRRYWTVGGSAGLVISVCDSERRIRALALRPDNPGERGGKYRVLSSKRRGGPGPGSPVHVPYFSAKGDRTVVRITEGVLKSDIATRLSGMLTIGLPGVGAWRRAARVLRELGAKVVRVAFDADACHNRNVAECLSHLVKHLRLRGFVVELEMWEEQEAKGIDDLLAAGKTPDLITGDEVVDSVVARIVADARKADSPPGGNAPATAKPEKGKACEAHDDPHVLARAYRKVFQTAGGLDALYYHRQAWYRWDGRAYRLLHEKSVRAELTAAVKDAFDRRNIQQLMIWEANGAEGPPPVAQPVTTKVIANVMQALCSLALLPDDLEAPAWLHACPEWDAADVLACKNALVHLPSLAAGLNPSTISPTPLFFSPTALDYGFDPAAMAPVNWFSFLEALWPKDQQAIEALQAWFGYCLLPETRLQKILMLVGPKRSGKGTIARVLRALIGIQNTASPTLASLGTNFGLQPLLNKTLAIISDARLSYRTDAAVVVERLLSISGEDAQTVDRKHLSAVTQKLPVRFMILTNELPKLNDPSGALVGRLILLRQTESWYGKEDTRLTDKLLTELPGILLWAIEGWKRLRQRDHFEQPKSGAKLVQQMEDLSSPIGVFLRECCEVGPGFEVPCRDLFSRWQTWCAAKGQKDPGTDQVFGRELHAAISGLDTKQHRLGSMRIRVYVGVRLRPEEEQGEQKPEEQEREPGIEDEEEDLAPFSF
jgi:putative DNA primase/helicase